MARAWIVPFAAAALITPQPLTDDAVKVAFYNIRSGKGVQPLRGHASPFADVGNCTDPSKPMNAWGTGLVQKTLTSALADPAIVAIGLAEAWRNVCASPDSVRVTLGWKQASSVQNGVALVARHGLKEERWQQLDTTRNRNPSDTAWVLRAAVCTEPTCRRTLITYVAHWYGTGPSEKETYETQARQTVAFMQATNAGRPHVLIGDLNVWTADAGVCRQTPNGAAALAVLKDAGYVDAWPRIHGSAEGYTGMLNRIRCGNPEGYAWKRIDYAWSPSTFVPLDATRFGISPPGDAAASDHYGIIATYPQER